MRLIRGDKLSDRVKEQVLAAYVYRWTHENPHRTQVYKCKLCDVRKPYENSKTSNGHNHPTIPLQHDSDWLKDHAFYVKNDGELANKPGHCEPAFLAV